MPAIVFNKQAKQDLISIGAYLHEKNPVAASGLIQRIYKSISHLSQYPYFGSTRDELGAGRRFLIVRPYLIIYTIVPNGDISIIRIVHGARYLPELL